MDVIGDKRLKRKSVFFTFIFINIVFILFSGCIEPPSTEKLGVLVTIVPQVEMVEFIGGEFVDVTVMVPAGESPHSFEPLPGQMTKVAQATIYFIVGSGVEFELTHMDVILEQNPALQVFDCSKEIDVISFNEHYGQDHYSSEEESGNEEGDQHNDAQIGTDPHIWTSPINFKKMAEVVYNSLITVDPDHEDTYFNNYQQYMTILDNLHENISILLQPFAEKSFMVYHPAWGYFGDTYHLKQIAIEDEGKQPGPAGVAAIIEQAKNENITIIFVTPQFDTSSAETIATEIGGCIVFADPLMTDYQSTVLHLAEDMVSGFET